MYLDIYQAIEQRHLLQMYYEEYFRVIEPRVYGRDFRGVDVLQAYQIGGCDAFGRHNGWKWFRAKDMDTLRVLSTHFSAHRSSAKLYDHTLQHVYCQVTLPPKGDGAKPAPPLRRRH